MIWERSKRKDTRLKTIDQRKIQLTPQASAGQLTPRILPLRLSGKSFQVACSAPPLSTKVPRNRCCILHASSQKVSPRRQMQDFERRRRRALLGTPGTVPAVEQAAVPPSSDSIAFRTQYSSFSPVTCPFHPLLKSCICREVSSRPAKILENSGAPFRTPFCAGVWVAEVTSE